MTAQATVREEAPSGTKQNFGCWEEPLRNPGRGRRGAARPGPAQAQLPGGCATARRNHARPRVRGLAGGGRPGLEGDAWTRHPARAGAETRSTSTRSTSARRTRMGCSSRARCGPLRGCRARRGSEERSAGPLTARAANEASSPAPDPGWDAPRPVPLPS